MKRAALIPALGLLLLACAYTDFLPATPTPAPPAASPTKTVHVTASSTASITPTLPTPTFTLTPTFIYSGPTEEPSNTPEPTGTIGLLITQQPINLTPQDPVFTTILVSGNRIYWGTCEPNFAKVTVHVVDPKAVDKVLIFLRLKDPKTGESTDWGGGAIMDTDNKGTFTYILTAQSFSHYREFASAWGQYQFVATGDKLEVIGRSAQYLNSLTIAPCP
jgi:hypothetical protein